VCGDIGDDTIPDLIADFGVAAPCFGVKKDIIDFWTFFADPEGVPTFFGFGV
jgi:hypothetical protein